MNPTFTLFASLMLRLATPHGPTGHAARAGERETATPSVDSVQVAAARRTAYLADALQLRYSQTQRVQRSTSATLQALDSLRFAALDAPARQAATAGIEASYQRALARTLTAGQYAALRQLETPETPEVVVVAANK